MSDLKITHWDVNTDGVFSEGKLKEKLEKEGFTVIPYTFSPGTVFPDHTHSVDKKDGITAGEFSFTMNGKTVVLSAGDTIFVPRNTVHAAHVVGSKDSFSAGNVFGAHTHDVDKMDVVVDGELEFSMYGKSIILKAGDALEVPKDVPHSAKVRGNKALEFFDATKL
ncbi:unnamed protein product [Hydatigera taeniaeformis]|uniref:Cupin domain-containing protein n=1 Tax=Hydatigena taeniaeformis TaxID=6205 RepID=A0A0R3XBN4_HYDTA|nr:unnamed protein product [Hydatigera taeniaeformis]